MLRKLLKYKWYIGIIFACIIIEPTLNSVLNFWLQRMFNSAEPGADKLLILRLLTIGFLLWMLKRIVLFISGVLKARFICNARQDIKHEIFVSLLKLNTANLTSAVSSGEYISIFTNDITLLENRFYNQIIGLISGIFSIAIMGTSFIVMSPKLAGAIIAFGVVSMFVPAFFAKGLNAKNLLFSNKISLFTQKFKEYTIAYPTIKNYSVEDKIVQKFEQINRETEDAKFEADYALALANNAGQLLSWFMQFIGVGLGLLLVIRGEILIGTVVAAQSFAGDLALPLQNIIININSIRSVKEIIKKLEVAANPTDIVSLNKTPQETSGFTLTEPKYDIAFEDLFLQIGNKPIINHFSFTFETGKKYLIVGVNGSGKSSIFKVLKRWFGGYTGRILLNGKDISELTNKDLSRVVSYLNESVSMFSGSVKENILLFRDGEIKGLNKAVSDAHVELELKRIISDEGRNISSGEQRRIEIARSLVESVRILIFDEVVSTLDIETAYEIEKLALDFKDKTIIFISHNFSGKLIKEYDEILVMENGCLLAHGKYEELVQNCPYFKKICEIKFGKV